MSESYFSCGLYRNDADHPVARGSRASVARPVFRICFIFIIVLVLLPGLHSTQAVAPKITYSDKLTWHSKGVCNGAASLVPEYEGLCERQQCVRSLHNASNIHLSGLINNLNRLPNLGNFLPSESASNCSPPTGGQTIANLTSTPIVSFIFTVHNNADISAMAILEVFRTAREVPSAEFIVLDDGSTEDMSAVRNLCNNLRLHFHTSVMEISNAHNVGDGGVSNNQAIQASRGAYIVLIDSNVLVQPTWLKLLVDTIKQFPQAGVVGPKMLKVSRREF